MDVDNKITETIALDARLLGPQEGQPTACLIIIAGNDVGKLFMLNTITEFFTIGRGSDANIVVVDEAVSRIHARIKRRGADSYVLEDLNSTNGTYCNGERVTERELTDGDKIMVGVATILKFGFTDPLEQMFQNHIFNSVSRDWLTNAFNKRYFHIHLRSEYDFAARHESDLSLLMFDLDHFKQINDTYGHMAGDQVLRGVAQLVITQIRSEDLFARYGGEEFVVLARNIGVQGALLFAERLRKAVVQEPFTFESVRIPVSISIGVAIFHDGEPTTPEALLERADRLLYRAKDAGRNRVCIDSDDSPGLLPKEGATG